MKNETIDALHRINREFYDSHAYEFSASRSRPWKGWERVTSSIAEQWSMEGRHQSVSILDVGCGNGRFAEFIIERWHSPIRYLGLDGSVRLLSEARQRVAGLRAVQSGFAATDLLTGAVLGRLERQPFDLIVLFGVLHHIAGLTNRRNLLQRLAAALRPGGHLVISFWRFGADARFRHRLIDWQLHRRQTGDAIDLTDLEAGDSLLAWGPIDRQALQHSDRVTPRRYCHFADDTEVDSLLGDLDLEARERFQADGKDGQLNLYVVMQKRHE